MAGGGGGIVGREYISFPGLSSSSSSSNSTAATTVDNKNKVLATIEKMTHETHMFDRLHETAYQTSYMGNSLGSPLYGTAESLGHVTKSDVDALLGTIHGGDVVVVATGGNNGSGAGAATSHDKLVEDVSKAYGNLPSSAKVLAAGSVVKAEDKSAFIGSDIR
jgi:predicted Zn-dependent peptidase